MLGSHPLRCCFWFRRWFMHWFVLGSLSLGVGAGSIVAAAAAAANTVGFARSFGNFGSVDFVGNFGLVVVRLVVFGCLARESTIGSADGIVVTDGARARVRAYMGICVCVRVRCLQAVIVVVLVLRLRAAGRNHAPPKPEFPELLNLGPIDAGRVPLALLEPIRGAKRDRGVAVVVAVVVVIRIVINIFRIVVVLLRCIRGVANFRRGFESLLLCLLCLLLLPLLLLLFLQLGIAAPQVRHQFSQQRVVRGHLAVSFRLPEFQQHPVGFLPGSRNAPAEIPRNRLAAVLRADSHSRGCLCGCLCRCIGIGIPCEIVQGRDQVGPIEAGRGGGGIGTAFRGLLVVRRDARCGSSGCPLANCRCRRPLLLLLLLLLLLFPLPSKSTGNGPILDGSCSCCCCWSSMGGSFGLALFQAHSLQLSLPLSPPFQLAFLFFLFALSLQQMAAEFFAGRKHRRPSLVLW
mmetsp:Transcript_13347/g.37579  ORF Transcript_13347/g.37579 Transcript_13347/m.37579 type:complete len:461 (-) Transcript_13347:44-1426(-)